MIVPFNVPAAAPVGGHTAAQVLAPRAWGTPQIDHHVARLDEPKLLVNLFELVGCAGTIALPLRQFDVRVVHMVV